MTLDILPDVKPVTIDDVSPYEEGDNITDSQRRTHVVNPPNNIHIWQPGMTAQEIVDIARLHRLEVRALCGYVFIPNHNPEKYDACELCMEIATQLMSHNGE